MLIISTKQQFDMLSFVFFAGFYFQI